MIRFKITHKSENDKQTLGIMEVYKNGIWQFSIATLELAWKNNKSNISRIPEGYYPLERHNTNNHPNTFLVEETGHRTGILIHIANYFRQLKGCIAVGLVHTDIDEDGYIDVKDSGKAMDLLREISEGEEVLLLEITNDY